MELVKVKSLYELPSIINADLEKLKKRLCFRESLIISKLKSPDPNSKEQPHPLPMGGICIDVQSALDDKFVIYISSKFTVMDGTGGSKISTWVDNYFYTIEEKRAEFLLSSVDPEKQSLYVGSEEDGMFVSHTINSNQVTKKKYSSNITNTFISEGANFVLMRLLALTMFKGLFEMSAMYINGDLCRNIYQCSGVSPSMINGVKLDTVKITRTVIEECGVIHCQTTILTIDGHIVKQEWANCEYIIQLNPIQDIIAFDISGEACGCENVLSLAAGWKNDLELMSKYLDRRQICEYDNKEYFEDTPEITELLADYVKTLLQHKPDRVLEFTSDYFLRYNSI